MMSNHGRSICAHMNNGQFETCTLDDPEVLPYNKLLEQTKAAPNNTCEVASWVRSRVGCVGAPAPVSFVAKCLQVEDDIFTNNVLSIGSDSLRDDTEKYQSGRPEQRTT